jgi:hypothetical protein
MVFANLQRPPCAAVTSNHIIGRYGFFGPGCVPMEFAAAYAAEILKVH